MNILARMLLPVLAAAIWTTTPTCAVAQAPSRTSTSTHSLATTGEELMVTYETDTSGSLLQSFRTTVRGELLMVTGRHLVIRTRNGSVVVDTASIRGIRRRVGTKPPSAPAMAMGSAAGFAAGFLVGALTFREQAAPGGATSASNRGLAFGVLVGAPTGAIVAWLASRSRPIYEDLSLGSATPGVAVSPGGTVRLSLSVVAP